MKLHLTAIVLLAACAEDRPLSPADFAAAADSGGTVDLIGAAVPDLAAPDLAHPDLATPGCPPPGAPATTQVQLRVHNGTATDRLVANPKAGGFPSGWCTAFDISGAAGSVGLAMGFQCLCECPNPGSTYANSYHRLKPGETFDLTSWDGRALTTCTAPYDCSQHGWPGLGIQQQLEAASSPLPPGAYRATVAVESQAPAHCSSPNGMDYNCSMQIPGFGPSPTAIEKLCPSSATASLDFTLPATGAITLTIELK